MLSREQMILFGILWVAGWSLLFLLYPALACRVFRREQTEGYVRRARMMGVIGLGLAIVSVILELAGRN
jgi:hypothetical protein